MPGCALVSRLPFLGYRYDGKRQDEGARMSGLEEQLGCAAGDGCLSMADGNKRKKALHGVR